MKKFLLLTYWGLSEGWHVADFASPQDLLHFIQQQPQQLGQQWLVAVKDEVPLLCNAHSAQASASGESITTPLYWDCNCKDNYIQYNFSNFCPKCGAYKEDQPDSRKDEVIDMIRNSCL